VLGVHISKERNMLIAEKFIRSLVSKYDKHTMFILMEVLVGIQRLQYNWIKTLSTFTISEKPD
jgi:hypothetical protein